MHTHTDLALADTVKDTTVCLACSTAVIHQFLLWSPCKVPSLATVYEGVPTPGTDLGGHHVLMQRTSSKKSSQKVQGSPKREIAGCGRATSGTTVMRLLSEAHLISLRPGLEPLRTKSAVRSFTRSFSSSCCMAVCLHHRRGKD